ncbi:MAG: biopolymer transporter ExbD [Rhodocyclaceae bacterium]|nr:biopolymer transporter ExbD [Rhodocyclaceae bacterium]MBP7079811.1 biopolymer transporter ExbD [Rhodocyclaceae bacterium]
MNFQRGRTREELEINLIPMIDVLLVILIFLLVTTTYSKFAGLEINLPTADTSQTATQPNEINVVVTASGDVLVNRVAVSGREISTIAAALSRHTGSNGAKEPVVIINADAKTPHQGVIDVMQAAQLAGLSHISFATQNPTR